MERRFFDTIQQFGGPKMQPLLEEVEGKKMKEKRFYIILRGRRKEDYIKQLLIVMHSKVENSV